MNTYLVGDSIPIKTKFTSDISGIATNITFNYNTNDPLNDLSKGVVRLTVTKVDTNAVAVTTLEGVDLTLDQVYMFAYGVNQEWGVFTIKEGLAEGSYRWFAQYALDDGSNIRSLQKTAYGEFEVASITGQPSQIPT